MKKTKESVLKRATEILVEIETLLGQATTDDEFRARQLAFEAALIRAHDIQIVLKGGR